MSSELHAESGASEPTPPEAARENGQAPTRVERGRSTTLAAVPVLPEIEERLQRLEQELARLQAARVEVHLPADSTPAHSLIGLGRRLLGSGEATAYAAPFQPAPTASSNLRPRWFLFELLAELRVIYRMFVDPRYRLSWMGKVLPIVLLALIGTSHFWFFPMNSLPLIGWLCVKAIDLLLAYILFKVLSHEARLYRQASPDLPASLRL